MKNFLKINPIASFFVYLLLIGASCLAAFYLFFSNYNSIGILPPRFEIKEVYSSEPWSFELGEYNIQFPTESIVMPVYLENNLTGLIIQGDGGRFSRKGGGSHDITGVFLIIDSNIYMEIKGDNIFLPLEDNITKTRLMVSAREQIKLPNLNTIGYSRVFIPHPEAHYLYLENNGTAVEAPYSRLDKDSHLILVYFSLLLLIIILVIKILTLDLHLADNLRNQDHTFFLLPEISIASGLLLIVYLGKKGYPTYPFDGHIQPQLFLLYALIAGLLFFLSREQTITPQSFGIQLKNIDLSIILAIVVAFIITAFSAMKFPTGTTSFFNSQRAILSFLVFLAYALTKEIFWRGFIQDFLERLGGKLPGIILTTLIFSSLFYLADTPSGWLENFFFIPVTSLILSYLYSRTKNILSCTLLHALLLFLPRILIF